MREIIIRSEYTCYPLWERQVDGLKNFPAFDLEISEELAKDIEDWGDEFEETYKPSDPANSGFSSLAVQSDFIKRGERLATRLRDELSSEFSVEYRLLGGGTFVP